MPYETDHMVYRKWTIENDKESAKPALCKQDKGKY